MSTSSGSGGHNTTWWWGLCGCVEAGVLARPDGTLQSLFHCNGRWCAGESPAATWSTPESAGDHGIGLDLNQHFR